MNYFEIGQRIRRIRKARGISQEKLAEMTGISVTHMSHIETANTKLSLPVFINIAQALEVQTDSLIYETPKDNINQPMREVRALLEGCDAREARILTEIMKAAKQSLDIYLP